MSCLFVAASLLFPARALSGEFLGRAAWLRRQSITVMGEDWRREVEERLQARREVKSKLEQRNPFEAVKLAAAETLRRKAEREAVEEAERVAADAAAAAAAAEAEAAEAARLAAEEAAARAAAQRAEDAHHTRRRP